MTAPPTVRATAPSVPPARTAAAPNVWLRRWLLLDAVVTGGNALVYLAVAGPVGRLLGLDSGLLVGLGAFLLGYAAAVGWLASRREPPAAGVWWVIGANVAWPVASLVAWALWLDPDVPGAVWIPAQAAVVAAFAALQYRALRR